MTVNGTQITNAHFFEENRTAESATSVRIGDILSLMQTDLGDRALETLLSLVRQLQSDFPFGQPPDEFLEVFRQLIISGVRNQLVQVRRDGTDILRDAPFIVVENAN